MAADEAAARRLEALDSWERAAAGWGKRAVRMREWGMPVSVWMVEHLELQPGQQVLELACGPGDTGFLAAEVVRPGGTLISSDGTEGMLEVARGRARELGIDNVEFKRLELEWIDLPTASVDAVLCRWGVMLSLDPAAALREIRRVLRPGGRAAVAVWDKAEDNPWGTIAGRSMIKLGFGQPPDPSEPGPFALSEPGRLQDLLEEAGFVEVIVEAIELERTVGSVSDFLEETLDCSPTFGAAYGRLSEGQKREVQREIESLAQPYTAADGLLRLPGRSLAALASA